MTHSKLEKAIPSVIYENQTLNALYIPMASDYCFMKRLCHNKWLIFDEK